jgi:hypothetical protein
MALELSEKFQRRAGITDNRQASSAADGSNYFTEQYKPDGNLLLRNRDPIIVRKRSGVFSRLFTPVWAGKQDIVETGVKYLGNTSRSTYEVINSSLPIDPSRSGNMQYKQQIFQVCYPKL